MARHLLPFSRQFLLLFAVVLLTPLLGLLGWALWSPGLDLRDGSHDLQHNGIWMGHGWLGDDNWFRMNHKEDQKPAFRDPDNLAREAAALRQHHISDLFPHLCPCTTIGRLPRVDNEQVERFLDAFADFRVLPWVGGVRDADAVLDDAEWRHGFAASCSDLLRRHPRLAGIHLNIEPVPNGDRDFLVLLDELAATLPRDKIISVAAYPPPTRWHPFPDVHWDESYSRAVGERAGQVVVMMYDTSLHDPKLYRQLMKDWTAEVLTWYPHSEVLLGVPAYDDASAGYHDPACENIVNAVAGIHAGLTTGDRPMNYHGVSLYAEWEMTPDKWDTFQTVFLAPSTSAVPENAMDSWHNAVQTPEKP